MSAVLIASLLVKSSVVAGAGLLAARFVVRRPVDRVDVLRAAVIALLLIPLIVGFGPVIQWALLPPVEPVVPAVWQGEARPIEGLVVAGSVTWPGWGVAALIAWLFGALVVAGRFGFGVAALMAWTGEGRAAPGPWRRALERLAPSPRPRLVESDRVRSPLSWGLRPGAILIDPASRERDEVAASAILAHELAHLKRCDWLFLLMSRLALALFWFNPLVWVMHRAMAEHSEEAADALALQSVDRLAYARTLVRLASHPARPVAAIAMAADARTLKTRIAAIMIDHPAPRRRMAVALSALGLVAIATPLAAVEIANQPTTTETSRTVVYYVGDADPPPAPPAPPAPPTPPAPILASVSPPAPPAPPAPVVLGFAPPAPPAPPTPPARLAFVGFAPPVPPVPPAPPPSPPAPLLQRTSSHVVVREATPADRRRAAEARAQADRARVHAEQARVHAQEQGRKARLIAIDARRNADAQRDHAERMAAHGREMAAEARVHAARAQAEGRAQMRLGAEQMRVGARQMREESVRLRDPAYRAEQIVRNREQGHTVTDAQLAAMSPQLARQAEQMDRSADQMARQAED